MYKIRIISCYFGELKPEFYIWLDSCRYNETIDFLFVTDQKISKQICPKNVKVLNLNLEDIKYRANRVFNFEVELSTPYKLCDYKIAYGLIFEEEFRNYDFWGYCDSDMVIGNIRKYLTNEILEKYDKFLPLGHLSIYRNTKEVNERFMNCPDIMDYQDVFSSTKIFQFDETPGIYAMYKNRNWKMLEYMPFLDIMAEYNQRLIKYIYAKRLYGIPVHNHSQQIFYFEKGRILEIYLNKEGKCVENEYLYIHSSKRHYSCSYEKIPSRYVFMTNKIFKIESDQNVESILKNSKKYHCLIEKILININVFCCKINKKIRL